MSKNTICNSSENSIRKLQHKQQNHNQEIRENWIEEDIEHQASKKQHSKQAQSQREQLIIDRFKLLLREKSKAYPSISNAQDDKRRQW